MYYGMRTSRLQLIALALLAGLLLAGCGGSTGTNATGTSTHATGAGPSAKVRALQHLSATSGWMLTDSSLNWATGLIPITHPITPPATSAADLSAVFFLDDQHGWAVGLTKRDANGGELAVSRTANGGSSWKAGTVKVEAGVSDIAAIDFVDALHGFLLANLETSSNFSAADLYSTSDGGATWTKITQVGGKMMSFMTPTRGFLVAGPQSDQLLVTNDGGHTWQRETIEMPRDYPGVQPTFAPPTFTDAENGVLPVTFSTSNSPAVGFYSSRDGGATWTLGDDGVRLVPGAIEPGVTLPTTVIDPNSWIVAAPDGHRVYSTATHGASWRAIAPNGLPSGVIQIDFATPANGWARVASASCAQGKSDCTVSNEALSTTDGGQTWAVVGG